MIGTGHIPRNTVCIPTTPVLLVGSYQRLLGTLVYHRGTAQYTENIGPCPLISGNGYSTSDLYMTPYSTIFSHWPAVVVIGCVGVVLFLLTVTSLFSSLL